MLFEEFKSKGGKFIPQITINKSGGFGMSSGMHHRYNLDAYSGVRIFFDKTDKIIGIKPMEKEGEGTFSLKKRPDQKGAFFSARSFLQAYDIDPKKYYGRYAPEEVEDKSFGKMFIIKLKIHE